MKKKILSRLTLVFGMSLSIMTLMCAVACFSSAVYADCAGKPTAVINCSDDDPKYAIFSLLGIVLNVLTMGIGIAATAGFLWCGYQYMTSKSEPAVIVKVKTRIMHIVIGLIVYAMFWGIINFLLPGGIFNGQS